MEQNGDKYYQCPVCWKEFSKPHMVKTHMRIHTGEKPYHCHYCPKSFTTSGNLGDHLRVHSTERLFKCKICGTKFKRKATLKRHFELHAKFKRSQNLQKDADILVAEEELLQTEIVNHPSYFSKYERSPRFQESADIIVSENNELLQTEIVNHPSHIHLDDLQGHRSPSIELLFPQDHGRDDQENIIMIPSRLKEKKLDDFYDATILELTEEMEDIEGCQVKVYSFPRNALQSNEDEEEKVEEILGLQQASHSPERSKALNVFSKSAGSANGPLVLGEPSESSPLQLDLSKRYGAYVTKMLKLIQCKDQQVELIKELNKAIHEFVIENR